MLDQKTNQSRYRLEAPLGSGGMGDVFIATDRLSDKRIAYKRLKLAAQPINVQDTIAVDGLSHSELRYALAQEFQTLASIRHPNIISVLDYGFDSQSNPYFTMELLTHAQPLHIVAEDRPLEGKIELLVQVLSAITYLHRRGIIHRDLKPDNVLVQNGRVKVLDFGLAIARQETHLAQAGLSGTLNYIAPELLLGSAPSEAADYYAFGVIAYEILVGHHPFQTPSFQELYFKVLNELPDPWASDLPSELAQLIDDLLNKDPNNRLTDGRDIINRLARFTGRADWLQESDDVRESFLQAARFVGRETETAILGQALNAAKDSRGSAWVIGGESGVGKSRLLQEIRTQALVKGAMVLEGQAVEDGHGLPFAMWRDVVRRLVLTTELDDLTAGVLQTIVPDIDKLLGRSIPPPPELQASAQKQRFFSSVIQLFRRQTEWILLIVEDLQWADESIEIMNRLMRVIGELPLVIISSYRNDERPDLPELIPQAKVITLDRFDDKEIINLTTAMLGEVGNNKALLQMLERETEGNTFFLVEVLRALAELSGSLDKIGQIQLPDQLFPKGIASIVERRLQKLSDESRLLLPGAAVSGRYLDINLLRHLLEALNLPIELDNWLTHCIDAAVLEVYDGKWRFTHDKVREGILHTMSYERTCYWHEKVARALEFIYPDDPSQAGPLAHHWGVVGDRAKEIKYSKIAGRFARNQYRHEEALTHLSHGLQIALRTDYDTRFELLTMREEIFALQGQRDAQHSDLDKLMSLSNEMFQRGSREARPQVYLRTAEYEIVTGEFEKAIHSAQKAIDDAKGNLDSAKAAAGYMIWGQALMRTGQYEAAQQQLESSLSQAGGLQLHAVKADSHRFLGVCSLELGQFEAAESHFLEALPLYQTIDNRQGEGTILNNLGIVAQASGQTGTCLDYWGKAQEIYGKIGDREGQARVLTNLCSINMDAGNFEQARHYGEEGLALCEEINVPFGVCFNLTNLSLVYHSLGEHRLAEGSCLRAREVAQELNSPLLIGYVNRDYGFILNDQNRFVEAEQAFQAALNIWTELSQTINIIEASAGLALAAIKQGDVQIALSQLKPILDHIDQGNTFEGAAKPSRIYLTCFFTLDAVHDERAFSILMQGVKQLRQQAAAIQSKEHQLMFLNIPDHRILLTLARQLESVLT